MDMSDYESARRNRRWRVEYDLAYDGGSSEFIEYYRTKIGAYIARFWNKHVTSWGGKAVLIDNHKKEK